MMARLVGMPDLFSDSGWGSGELPRALRPGLVHLPRWMGLDQQFAVVQQCREIARSVAGTPLAMHRQQWAYGTMSAYLMSLGLHWEYRTYQYVSQWGGVAVPPIPVEFSALAHEVLCAAAGVDDSLAAWVDSYRIDAALVNYYPPGAGMGMHQDAFEDSRAPVVSLSIGDSAVFRAGNGVNRQRPWQDVVLGSGDAVVFGGPSRDMFHSVVRLHEGTAPTRCGVSQGRINLTFRQVKL